MDDVEKRIRKMPLPEQEAYRTLLRRIARDDLVGLDIKKLKGANNFFRVRVGDWRIVFTHRSGANEILHLGRRNESTYRDL